MKVSQSSKDAVRGIKVVGEHPVEYLRVADCVKAYGLSRPHLFELIAKGQIRSKHLKREGATRGLRLIEVESLRQFIASFGD